MNFEDGFYKIDSTVWGNTFWKTIYYIIFSYDVNNKDIQELLHLFFLSLGGLLPCPDCQEHYQTYFQKHDIRKCLSKKKALWNWVYHLNREIFIREKKHLPAWSFEDWKENAIKMIE